MFAAVILAGGAARRVGGATKPTLQVGGEALLNRVLAAVPLARPRIVVGPAELADLLPSDVTVGADVAFTRESPPGGGPVAAIAAGLSYLDPAAPETQVAVLAGDLPFLSSRTLETLRDGVGLASSDGAVLDGAVLVDASGQPQWLIGVWRLGSLVGRLNSLGDPAGRAVRDLISGLRVAQVRPAEGQGPPPWFDCDTNDDLRQAEEWVRADTR